MHLLCISNMQNLYYIVWSPRVARVHTMWKNIAYNWYIKKLFLTIGDEQIYFWFHEENTFCEPIYIYIYIYFACFLSFTRRFMVQIPHSLVIVTIEWLKKKFHFLLVHSYWGASSSNRWHQDDQGLMWVTFFFFFLRKLCGLLN